LLTVSPNGRFAVVALNGSPYVVDRRTGATAQVSECCFDLSNNPRWGWGLEDDGRTLLLGISVGAFYDIFTHTYTYLKCPDGVPPNSPLEYRDSTVYLDNANVAGIATEACGDDLSGSQAGYLIDL